MLCCDCLDLAKKTLLTRYSGHHFSRLACFWSPHDQTTGLSYCMREGNTQSEWLCIAGNSMKAKADLINPSSTLHNWDGLLLSDRVIDTPVYRGILT